MVSGHYLRVMWGNVVRSVHAMFHSDKGNRLVADKTHRFCAPHRQHKCIGYLSVHSVLNSRFLESTFSFLVGFKARHDFRFAEKKIPSTNLSARVVAIDTHNLRDPQSSR